LVESLDQPNHSPETNLFIAERAGEIVGYADARPEWNLGRVVLGCLVHPKHRRGGLTLTLVHRAIGRTRELGIKIIHVNILQKSVTAKHLFTKMGFTFVRRFLELRLDLSGIHLPGMSQRVPRCRPLQPGEEERLTQLQNRSFAGSWGYNANTVEDILYRIRLPNCSLEDILLALDADKHIGYCWTKITSWENKALREGTGRITMLGVESSYRGRGIGRQLLLAGLSYLKSKGLRVVELTVDRENKVARALYKTVGFRLWTSSLWYEKRLD